MKPIAQPMIQKDQQIIETQQNRKGIEAHKMRMNEVESADDSTQPSWISREQSRQTRRPRKTDDKVCSTKNLCIKQSE